MPGLSIGLGIGSGAKNLSFPLRTRHVDATGIYDKRISLPATAHLENKTMHTARHGIIATKTGEPVEIVFTVTDQAGNAVELDGASATYKIARRAGETALLTKTENNGVALAANLAIISFHTAELADENGALTGDFFAQLTITIDGEGLIVAEGTVSVCGVIG